MVTMQPTRQYLLSVAAYGYDLLAYYKDKPQHPDIYAVFTCLVGIETLLDIGKTVLLSGDGDEGSMIVTAKEIYPKIDEIRMGTIELAKNLDPKIIKSTIENRSYRTLTAFGPL